MLRDLSLANLQRMVVFGRMAALGQQKTFMQAYWLIAAMFERESWKT